MNIGIFCPACGTIHDFHSTQCRVCGKKTSKWVEEATRCVSIYNLIKITPN